MFFITYFKEIILSISALVGLYLLKRNKSLTCENQVLAETSIEKDKVIHIQERVLNEAQNIDNLSADERIKRLYEYQNTTDSKNKSS